MSRPEIGEQIVQIMKEGLSGVAWEEIEREGDDDAHRW
jgi:hypothetical protein